MRIKFKRKQFTIQEGHYTGPKDYDKVPGAIEVIGKSALAGTGIGAITGKLLPNSTMWEGAKTGGKIGTIAGIALKFFLNYLHNPMNKIKYSEVDKVLRREFGVYRAMGITVGDKVSSRSKIEEKFSFNDRNVCNYKVNIAICNDQVTMYTFGMTDSELQKTSDLLDYYCKKYTGMEYTSILINRKVNAYSVVIVFTNYQVISNFLVELANKLETKINILDNKAIVDLRIKDRTKDISEEDPIEDVPKAEDDDNSLQKSFSFKLGSFGKYDLIRLLGSKGIGHFGSGTISLALLSGILNKLSIDERSKIEGMNLKMGELRNPYLKSTLSRLHYIDGVHYTVGDNEAEISMSLINGIFLITVNKKSPIFKNVENNFYKKLSTKIKRIDSGDVVVYSYPVQSKQELDMIINTLMKSIKGEKINLFDK